MKELLGHQDYISTLISLNDGNIATGSLDSTILIWNPYESVLIRKIEAKHPVYTLAQLTGGYLAAGLSNGEVSIWDLNNGNLEKTINNNNLVSPITGLIALDYNTFACSQGNRVVNMWYAVTVFIHEIDSSNYKISVWNPDYRIVINTFSDINALVNDVEYFHDGYLVAALDDGNIKIWDYHLGKLIYNMTGHVDSVKKIIWLNNEEFASGSRDGEIKIWNYTNGELLKTVKCEAKLNDLVSFANGFLAASFTDATLKILNHSSGEIINKRIDTNLTHLLKLKDFYLVGTNRHEKHHSLYCLDFTNEKF